MKHYKICRVRCRLCGDVLEHVNQSKTERSSLVLCSCRKVGLDPAAVMYRVLGEPSHYEDLSVEWEDAEDLREYEKAIKEYRTNKKVYTLQEVVVELELEELGEKRQHKKLEERLVDYYGKPIEEIERIKDDKEYNWGKL